MTHRCRWTSRCRRRGSQSLLRHPHRQSWTPCPRKWCRHPRWRANPPSSWGRSTPGSSCRRGCWTSTNRRTRRRCTRCSHRPLQCNACDHRCCRDRVRAMTSCWPSGRTAFGQPSPPDGGVLANLHGQCCRRHPPPTCGGCPWHRRVEPQRPPDGGCTCCRFGPRLRCPKRRGPKPPYLQPSCAELKSTSWIQSFRLN